MNFNKKAVSWLISLLFFSLLLLPVLKMNNFFRPKKEDTVKKDTLALRKDDEENTKTMQSEVKQEETAKVNDKKPSNNISLPKAIVFDLSKKESSDKKTQQVEEKKEIISNNSLSPENDERLNNMIVHNPVKAINVQSETSEKNENSNTAEVLPTVLNHHAPLDVTKKENSGSPLEKTEGTKKVTAKPAEKFDFENYSKNLVIIAGLKEGERIPVLELDGHNYKEGLNFYGFVMVARPDPLPTKESFYFIVNNSNIILVKEKSPYIGAYYPATQDDTLLFRRLLAQSSYSEIAKTARYFLFYVPANVNKELLIKGKVKTILDSYQLHSSDALKIYGKFKKIDDAYILIIEAFEKVSGEIIKVTDPDIEKFAFAVNSGEVIKWGGIK